MKAKNPGRQERLAAALRENLKRRKALERTLAKDTDGRPSAAVEPRPIAVKKPD
jgi:hypothetical protein